MEGNPFFQDISIKHNKHCANKILKICSGVHLSIGLLPIHKPSVNHYYSIMAFLTINSTLIWTILCVVAAFIFRMKMENKTTKKNDEDAYSPNEFLLTDCEKNFYKILRLATGEQASINCKVRMADIVSTKRKNDVRNFNRICAKHIDFVICDASSTQILCAIELNDRSHHTNNRRQRDIFVNKSLSKCGIKFLEIEARQNYSVDELRKQIFS